MSDNHIESVDAGCFRIVKGVAFIKLSERGTKVEEQALALALKVFMEYEAPEYPIEGVEEFKRTLKSEDYLKQLQFYVAIAGDGVVGVLATRNSGSHVALFFIDSRYHRQGIGRELMNMALADCPCGKMTVHSSPYALKIYEILGFTATDSEQIENGIRFTPMSRVIRSVKSTAVRKLCHCDLNESDEKAQGRAMNGCKIDTI